MTVGPGYASLPNVGSGLDGIGGGGEASYGLSAFWSLAAGAFFGHHFGDTVKTGDTTTTYRPTDVTSIWLGPRFNLDVFAIVPFVSLAPEILLTHGELQPDQDRLDYGLRAVLGFDYRPQRHWSAGLEVDYHAFLRDPLTYPVFVSVLVRLSFYYDFREL
jgi:hypothetical protein